MRYTKDSHRVSPTFLFIHSNPPLIPYKSLLAKVLSHHCIKNACAVAGSVKAQEPVQGDVILRPPTVDQELASVPPPPITNYCAVTFCQQSNYTQFQSTDGNIEWCWPRTNTCKPH